MQYLIELLAPALEAVMSGTNFGDRRDGWMKSSLLQYII